MSIESSSVSARVSRGGGWYFVPQIAQVARRSGLTSGNREDILGFRLVRRCP